MFMKAVRMFSFAALLALLVSIPGCTARSITITTNPPGAEVTINRRLIGISPCRVGFTHYGAYRIEIRKEKYETLVKEECINAPLYGYDPVSFVTDNAIPARLNDDIYLHYVLKKEGEVTDRTALLQRANMARSGVITGKDGTTINVAYSVPPKTAEQLAKDAQKAADTAATQAKDPNAPVKPDEFKIKAIPTEEPKGPTIGKELNIKPSTPSPDKKPDAPKAPEPKKDQPPVRTPKNEETIFEKPEAPKAEEPKPETPRPAVPRTEVPKPESIKN